MESKKQLSQDEESEIKSLWKKLVKLFHPDRYADDPEKLETYTKLTAAINEAKDNGDLETLRRLPITRWVLSCGRAGQPLSSATLMKRTICASSGKAWKPKSSRFWMRQMH